MFKYNIFTSNFDYYEPASAGTGDVIGPVTAIDENIAVYNSTTGKIIKDSGINISAVSANTLKVTNATHTGDVTGDEALTIGAGKVTETMQVLADNTTNDVSTTKHGYAPKGDGTTTKFLNANGSYSTPSGGGNVSTSGTPVDNDFAKFVNGTNIEGRSYTEVKSDLSLDNVTNVATDDTAYNATSWDLNTDSATKNAIRDKIETMDTAIGLNTAKDTNVPTSLSTGTVTATTYGITSDGSANDIVLPEANTDDSGLLGADKWDEIVANTDKITSKWEIDGTETQLITADEIDMQSKKIINLLDPTSNQEAATKKYVDDTVIPDTDAKVGIDVGATPDYLGAAAGDGALRVDATLDYTDGGNFITLGLDSTLKSNYDAAYSHISADGSSHTFIDQSVVSGGSPTFDGNNFTGIDADDVDIADAGSYYTGTETETALQEVGLSLTGKADVDQTFYIGTTQVAINRASAALTLAGLTLTTPDLGTPSAGVLTNCTFPTLNQNTSGTAANLSGTPALPNGTTATTQSSSDNSTKLATTAYADAAGGGSGDVTKVDTPLDNQIGVWTGDGTIEGTTGLTYTGTSLGITGGIQTTGDIEASSNGGTTSVPRVFGFNNLSSGEAVRFQFGDEHNAFQNSYGNDVQIYSYWGLVLAGGMQNYNDGFVPPAFTQTTDTGVLILSTNDVGDDPGAGATNIVTLGIQAVASQTNNLTEWRNSASTVLASVSSAGNFATKALDVTGNITVSGTVDGVDIAAEETRLANTSGTNTGDNTICTSGTATTAVTLATTRAIYGNNFDGSAALTQIIASTYGGTGNGFTKFTGPATAERTFTLPNANATLLYSGGDAGTPSALVGTNISGTASGLTAGAVTGVTLASGSLTLAGADALTLTTSAATDVTLPTTGTLLANVSEDASPELGGEMDAGAHTIGFTQQSATGDGTTTIDWKLGNKFEFTFGAANETFTFTAPSNPCNILLKMIQDGTGSRTATWPATVKWPAGTAPTLTTTASAVDIISFYFDGINYYGSSTLAFA